MRSRASRGASSVLAAPDPNRSSRTATPARSRAKAGRKAGHDGMGISGGRKTGERSRRERKGGLWQYSFGPFSRRTARPHGPTIRPAHRPPIPKTLTGILASIMLAILGRPASRPTGFTGNPPPRPRNARPPRESHGPARRTAEHPRRVHGGQESTLRSGVCRPPHHVLLQLPVRCRPPDRPGELRPGIPGRETPRPAHQGRASLSRRSIRKFPSLLARSALVPRLHQTRRERPLQPTVLPASRPGVRGRPPRPVQPRPGRGRARRPVQRL